MARGNNTQAVINITTNATKAQNDIEKLDKLLKKLNQTKKLMEKDGQTNTAAYKKLKQDIKSTTEAQKENISAQARMNRALKNIDDLKLKNLKREYRLLAQELGNFSGKEKAQAEQWRRNLDKIKGKIAELEGTTRKFGTTHGSIWSTAVRNITAYVGVFGAFNMLKGWLTDIIKLNAKLSDQMADIRKVSGLSMESIRELTTNLSKIDTRTTLEELNRIAYAGAKLGFGNYGIEGLEQFTKAANQVNVALKEDLGDEALTALSKITENMGLIKKMGVEDAMLATGSAMFKLASSSTAAAGPIVEVTKRLVPVAKASGLATSEILALSSAADSLQLMPEVVGTALSKFIMALQTNHNLIENFFHIEPGTIANLFQTGKSMDALLLVFDKMKGKNVTELSDVWKLLGSNGQRLMTVLLSMANATDRVREHLQISNQAFKEGTAVTEEYNIQQETAQALYERAQNMWRNAFINPEASESVKEIAKAWYDFTKEITSGGAALWSLKQTVDLFIFSLKILIYLLPGLAIGGIVRGLGSLVIALGGVKVATDGLTLSWKKMTAATKANWIGLLAAAIAQVVYWVSAWTSANEEAEERQKRVNDAVNEAKEKAEQEIKTLGSLKKQLDNVNISQSERNALLSKVRSDYDVYLNYLGVEINNVKDLAKHYNALNKVIKQRFAYEERENYKKEVMGGEGGSRMNRRRAGAELTKEAQKFGVKADLDLIQTYVKNGKSAEQITQLLFPSAYNATKAVNTAESAARAFAGPGAAIGLRTTRSQKNFDLKGKIQKYVSAVLSERNEEKAIDAAFAQDIGDFDYDKWLRTQVQGEFKPARDKAAERAQAKAARDAAAAERKRQAAARKAAKVEFDQVKEESTALIKNIEAYYNMQEEAINQMVADGKYRAAEGKSLVSDLTKQKDRVLAEARLAISGHDNDFDNMRKNEMGIDRDMFNVSEESQKTLEAIRKVDLQAAYKKLARFDGSDAVYGFDSGAFLNEIFAKATEYKKKAAQIEAEQVASITKILESYDLLEQLNANTADNFIKLGLFVADFESAATDARMKAQKAGKFVIQNSSAGAVDSDIELDEQTVLGTQATRKQSPFMQMLEQFRANGIKPYNVDHENDQQLAQWLLDFASNYQTSEDGYPVPTDWAKQNKQVWDWFGRINSMSVDSKTGMFDSDELQSTMEPIRKDLQVFFLTLMEYEKNYYETRKKVYEEDKRNQEQRFKVSGEQAAYDNQQQSLEFKSKFQQASGAGLNFWQQNGLASAIAEDPEIQRIQLRMMWRQKEYEDAVARGAAQELINERQTQMLEEFSNLAQKVSSEVAERVQQIRSLSEPLESWGEEVGQMLGEKWQGISQEGKLSFRQMTRNMGIEYAKLTLKLASEYLIQKLQQKVFLREMEKERMSSELKITEMVLSITMGREAAIAAIEQMALQAKKQKDSEEISSEADKATIATLFGISEGSAKLIGTLALFGIPLIAVITAILMGLLNSAKAAAGKGSTGSTSKPTAKLVSGMLTYDEGTGIPSSTNTNTYAGSDGHLYNATPTNGLPSGVSLITKPIATTVNGNPALVAERGPEIVIGRKTTRHIMMNEPHLLRALANVDSRHGARLRTFDDGTNNLDTLLGTNGPSETNSMESYQQYSTQMMQTMTALTQTVTMLQQRLEKPIIAQINKYGTGGLIDEVKSGLKFDNKYNK